MKILHGFDDIKFNYETAVTVGKFDGLHMGHDILLNHIVDCKKNNIKSVVVTFDRQPSKVLLGKQEKLIMTRDEKYELFKEHNIDYVIEICFDEKFMCLSPLDFVELLVNKLNMKKMVVGSDFRFGYKNSGDVELLLKLAEKKGFDLEIIEKLQSRDRDISSTYIREEISIGNIENANFLLGYPYYVVGEIIHGNGIGAKKIGKATINMIPSEDKLLPRCGVYVTEVFLENRKYHGVSNVGYRPTIKEKEKVLGIETHILDFNHEVYDKKAKVLFYKFIREEKKFDNINDLKKQIETDVRTTYCYFNKK